MGSFRASVMKRSLTRQIAPTLLAAFLVHCGEAKKGNRARGLKFDAFQYTSSPTKAPKTPWPTKPPKTWPPTRNPTPAPTPVFPCVPMRYELWADLDEDVRETNEMVLNYTESSWENEGNNTVEGLSWDKLPWEEQEAASAIGFDEDTWDCWVNHYDHYFWWELELDGLSQHFEVLGWNESTWSADSARHDLSSSMIVSEISWDQLTVEEKIAADHVCYFRGNWDKEPLEAYEFYCNSPTDYPQLNLTAT